MGRDDQLAEATIRIWNDARMGAPVTEEETAYLVAELGALPLHRITPLSAGPAPAGTRAGGALESGVLLITLSTAASVVVPLVRLLQDWLARRNAGSIDMQLKGEELRLTSVGRAEQRMAIERFFASIEGGDEASAPPEAHIDG
ncbi:hypothetical protein ACIRD9_21675 [Streptomyces violaceus]|jgi:hypothetical protein|uniref:hypothetical protein n=1 Tax=Streptomyces violaceus TaxID=1936 RepID=UPI00382255DA